MCYLSAASRSRYADRQKFLSIDRLTRKSAELKVKSQPIRGSQESKVISYLSPKPLLPCPPFFTPLLPSLFMMTIIDSNKKHLWLIINQGASTATLRTDVLRIRGINNSKSLDYQLFGAFVDA
ncbi:MAG: hypothetical protein RMY34_22985 [Aulosira sp. DedQUE10]|nr:hypothetical protein [Aulosira sp. DedQUE10]